MAWLRLLRVSAFPSAASNILMAFLLASGSWQPAGSLAWLLVAALSLYGAGMVLNDWFDRERDAQHRPNRPLPAGQISANQALVAVVTLVAIGWVAAASAGWEGGRWSGFPLGIALLLTLLIYLYDGPLKRTWLAPLVMGSCRGMNVLLGASPFLGRGEPAMSGRVIWVAIGISILVTGITWLARRESEHQTSRQLIGAAATLLAGLVFIAALPWALPATFASGAPTWYPILLGLISLPVVWRTVWAIRSGTPSAVQAAVVTSLRSLIFLDATLCWLAAPDQPLYALAVLALIFPATLLGRAIPTT